MIPARVLTQTVVRVRPALVTDAYGDEQGRDYTEAANRETIRALLAPTGGSEVTDSGSRDAIVADWLLVTDSLDLDGLDRIEWDGNTFEIVGPVLKPSGPSGREHHAEARLRVVTG